MKKITSIMITGAVAAFMAVIVGCEWESTEDSFNTSKGAGILVNFSGVYRATDGGFLVGSNITQLVLAQAGNAVEIWDNNNSYYKGSVGSPGVIASADAVSGAYPAGAIMVQSQINFAGRNAADDNDVNFVGIIHAVAVSNVEGETQTSTVATNDASTLNYSVPVPGGTFAGETVTQNDQQNTSTKTYTITDANTQYVLDGNWIQGSGSTSISAVAPAQNSTFTVN